MNEKLHQLRAEITKLVSDHVAEVKRSVIPELWLSHGIGENCLIVKGVEYDYKGDGTDNVLMLIEFMIEMPERMELVKVDAANLQEGMEAVLANKKAVTFLVTASTDP